ncbi:MAG: Rpn family recombination-promoting nuclease/putative transposase [Lachnospiraceae bacterium]|nr:Rpn family recombination-promoting nuclease/putative transposase [Lachnospiraceae bacterium]
MNEVSVINNQRDTVFRMLFKEKKQLLSLYNAIAETRYSQESELEIKTLENAIFMTYKNDLAFLIRTDIHLYEHQSTVNPNMPLRFLQYFSEVLEKDYINTKIYTRTRIMLPSPTFVVFYNGQEEQPERREFRLSDSYEGIESNDDKRGQYKSEKPINLELVAIQLNINPGYNEKLKKDCPALMGYVAYWEKIRRNKESGMPFEKAIKSAVDECIEEGILSEFFRRNKAEVEKMSIFEFDQKEYEQLIREEAKEEQKEEDKKIIAEKDNQIAEKENQIAEKDSRIAELERQLALAQKKIGND